MPGQYTWGEKLELARLEAKMARQVVGAGHEDGADWRLERRAQRIHDKAEDRYARNAGVALGALETAEDELAKAEHALRTAKGPDRAAARQARNAAKDRVRRADKEARRYR